MVGWYATGIRYTTDMTTCTEYAVRDSGDLLGREGSSRDILGRHAGKSCAGTCRTGILGRDTGQEMAAEYAAGHPGDMPQGHLQGLLGRHAGRVYRRMSAGQSGSVSRLLAGLPGRDILGGHAGGYAGGVCQQGHLNRHRRAAAGTCSQGMSQDMLGGNARRDCRQGMSEGPAWQRLFGRTCSAGTCGGCGQDIGRADGENAVWGHGGRGHAWEEHDGRNDGQGLAGRTCRVGHGG